MMIECWKLYETLSPFHVAVLCCTGSLRVFRGHLLITRVAVFYVACTGLLRFISTTQHETITTRRVQSRGVFDRKHSGRPAALSTAVKRLIGPLSRRDAGLKPFRFSTTPVRQPAAAEFTRSSRRLDHLACLLASSPLTSIHARITRPPAVSASRRLPLFCCSRCVAYDTSSTLPVCLSRCCCNGQSTMSWLWSSGVRRI